MSNAVHGTCLLAVVGIIVGAPAFARCLIDEDMGGDSSRLVWCDGFDSYCVAVTEPWTGYPEFPAVCPNVGASADDHAEFRANWPKVVPPSGLPGSYQWLSTSNEQAGVYSLQFEGFHVATRHAFDLTDAILHKNAAHNAINGSDTFPLILKFYSYHGNNGASANSPYYLELHMNGDRAPTNYVMVSCDPPEPGCNAVGPYPIICQQDPEHYNPVDCPPADPNDYHASVAMGFLAPMDRNPCDLQTGCRPTLDHPVVYNGRYWLEPRSNQWPPTVGDFNMGGADGFHTLKLTITSTQIIFTYSNELPSGCAPAFPCFCTIPRDYTGPFNTVSSGPGAGCQLDVNDADLDGITNECAPGADYKMLDYVTYTEDWNAAWNDTMVLYDGVTTSVSGACCLDDATCVETTEPDCENNLGGRFQGNDTLCANVQCCPYPFADGDTDGDVDQADFGLWQACYDGGAGLIAGCECYDRVTPAGVDGDDFTELAHCFTGANVPFDPDVQTDCDPGD